MKTLAPALLVAMPDLMDPNFSGCVVLVTQHDATGSFGLVINRGTDLPVRVLCENLKMSWTGDQKARVKWGGPVFPEHGWVLVGDAKSDVMSLQNVSEGILFTSSPEDLRALAGQPRDRIRVVLGFCGWGPGQLEQEISAGSWLVPNYRNLTDGTLRRFLQGHLGFLQFIFELLYGRGKLELPPGHDLTSVLQV